MFSCSQACMVRYYGASEQQCLDLVNTQNQSKGCSRSFGSHSFKFCSECADLTDQCPFGSMSLVNGVPSGEPAQKGCSMDPMTEAEAKKLCGRGCHGSNFCCNNPDIGSNQMFSYSQACMVRYYGASEQQCLDLVNTQTQSKGCSRSFGSHSFKFCSECADLTDQCPFGSMSLVNGVPSGEPAQKGCSMVPMTEAEAKKQCGSRCLESSFCCNNPDIGSNQMFSCSQACMVRYYGASEQQCLDLVNTQTQSKGCSRSFGAHSFKFCSKCADLTDQCPFGSMSLVNGVPSGEPA